MEIEDWPSAKHIPALYRELKALDLLEHLAELEAFGFTVLPPDKVGPPELLEETTAAVKRIAAERKGCSEDELEALYSDGQELMRFVLWDDPVFERLVLNPAALGLIQWLVGTDCILSLCNAWVKGRGQARTAIHADWAQFEMPTMAVEPFGANFNYLLTDYSAADGGLSFVPGSHRWRRLPSVEEAQYWNDNATAVEAPAGSMIIWGDHTWHGSTAKETDGLRLMVLALYNRPHMQTQEAYRETATLDALQRNPKRFTRLMNVHHVMPWGKTPDYAKAGRAPQGYISLFDNEPLGEGANLPEDFRLDEYRREVGQAIQDSMGQINFPDHYKIASSNPRRDES